MVARPLLSIFPATVIFKICTLRRVRHFSRDIGSKTEKHIFFPLKKCIFFLKLYTLILTEVLIFNTLSQRFTNFPKILEPSENSRNQKDDMQQVSHTQYPRILFDTCQNLVGQVPWSLGTIYPCFTSHANVLNCHQWSSPTSWGTLTHNVRISSAYDLLKLWSNDLCKNHPGMLLHFKKYKHFLIHNK